MAMEFNHHFRKAQSILQRLNPAERVMVDKICTDIQAAQRELGVAAAKMAVKCTTGCEGICCRNVQLQNILGMWDFVFIMASDATQAEVIESCLQGKSLIYSADCIFLKNGIGPCRFPENIRPEMCVTSYCDNELPNRQIQRVKSLFFKLRWHIILRKPLAFFNLLPQHPIPHNNKSKT